MNKEKISHHDAKDIGNNLKKRKIYYHSRIIKSTRYHEVPCGFHIQINIKFYLHIFLFFH